MEKFDEFLDSFGNFQRRIHTEGIIAILHFCPPLEPVPTLARHKDKNGDHLVGEVNVGSQTEKQRLRVDRGTRNERRGVGSPCAPRLPGSALVAVSSLRALQVGLQRHEEPFEMMTGAQVFVTNGTEVRGLVRSSRSG